MGYPQLSYAVRTADPSFKAGVAPFCEEGRSLDARGGHWPREVGGKQEVGWRTWGCESVMRPSLRPSDRGRLRALATPSPTLSSPTLSLSSALSPSSPSCCRLPPRTRSLRPLTTLFVLKQGGGKTGFKARLPPPYRDSASGLSHGWVAGLDLNFTAILGPQDSLLLAQHSIANVLRAPSSRRSLLTMKRVGHPTTGRGWL